MNALDISFSLLDILTSFPLVIYIIYQLVKNTYGAWSQFKQWDFKHKVKATIFIVSAAFLFQSTPTTLFCIANPSFAYCSIICHVKDMIVAGILLNVLLHYILATYMKLRCLDDGKSIDTDPV